MADTLEAQRAKHGRKGPKRAKRQSGKTPSVDVSSLSEEERNKPIATGVRLMPDRYGKAHNAAKQAGMSFNGYIEALIARDQVDETGRPLWAQQQPVADILPGLDGQLSSQRQPDLKEAV